MLVIVAANVARVGRRRQTEETLKGLVQRVARRVRRYNRPLA